MQNLAGKERSLSIGEPKVINEVPGMDGGSLLDPFSDEERAETELFSRLFIDHFFAILPSRVHQGRHALEMPFTVKDVIIEVQGHLAYPNDKKAPCSRSSLGGNAEGVGC